MNSKHRKQLSETIRDYLSGSLSAFEFDELLDRFRDSEDSTVQHIAGVAWYFYDDCKDHFVHMSKPAWNYFQRLLLVLESEAVIFESKKRHWHWTQLLALVSLLLVGIAATQIGLSTNLLLLIVPSTICSYGIAHCHLRAPLPCSWSERLAPFASFSELRATYAAAPRFKKTRYPKQIDEPTRTKLEEYLIRIQGGLVWTLFSPFVLLFQVFPRSSTDTQVVLLR